MVSEEAASRQSREKLQALCGITVKTQSWDWGDWPVQIKGVPREFHPALSPERTWMAIIWPNDLLSIFEISPEGMRAEQGVSFRPTASRVPGPNGGRGDICLLVFRGEWTLENGRRMAWRQGEVLPGPAACYSEGAEWGLGELPPPTKGALQSPTTAVSPKQPPVRGEAEASPRVLLGHSEQDEVWSETAASWSLKGGNPSFSNRQCEDPEWGPGGPPASEQWGSQRILSMPLAPRVPGADRLDWGLPNLLLRTFRIWGPCSESIGLLSAEGGVLGPTRSESEGTEWRLTRLIIQG